MPATPKKGRRFGGDAAAPAADDGEPRRVADRGRGHRHHRGQGQGAAPDRREGDHQGQEGRPRTTTARSSRTSATRRSPPSCSTRSARATPTATAATPASSSSAPATATTPRWPASSSSSPGHRSHPRPASWTTRPSGRGPSARFGDGGRWSGRQGLELVGVDHDPDAVDLAVGDREGGGVERRGRARGSRRPAGR